jgi:hypothetical protein
MRCLIDNKDKLGGECAAAVKIMQDRRAALRAACKDDSDKLCGSDATAKGSARLACLRSKMSELSKPCADALAALPSPAQQQ